MRGIITNRDVLAHLRIIWTEFGPACVFRCLFAMLSRQPTTFLDIALKEASR
jgi:hypothetical protein